jgi:hypothetical protein
VRLFDRRNTTKTEHAMKLSELKLIQGALNDGTDHIDAVALIAREIAALEGKVDQAKMEFNAYCTMFGLKPEHLAAVFTFRSRQYRIVGVNPSAPKFGISVQRLPDGRRFKFPHREIVHLLPKVA